MWCNRLRIRTWVNSTVPNVQGQGRKTDKSWSSTFVSFSICPLIMVYIVFLVFHVTFVYMIFTFTWSDPWRMIKIWSFGLVLVMKTTLLARGLWKSFADLTRTRHLFVSPHLFKCVTWVVTRSFSKAVLKGEDRLTADLWESISRGIAQHSQQKAGQPHPRPDQRRRAPEPCQSPHPPSRSPVQVSYSSCP